MSSLHLSIITQDSPLRVRAKRNSKKTKNSHNRLVYEFLIRAGDGTRTRDNLLGRQALYQLSYSRIEHA